MPWCPKCKSEYREGFTECATCHVPLVDELPEEDETRVQDTVQAEPAEETVQIENPIAVYTSERRIDAEMIRDMRQDRGIAAGMRQVMSQQSGAVSGRRALPVLCRAVGSKVNKKRPDLVGSGRFLCEGLFPVDFMLQRSGTMPKVEAELDAGSQVPLCAFDAACQRNALRQSAGDGRGQCAARAVRVRVVDARGGQPVELAVGIKKVVCTVGQVAALDEYSALRHRGDLLRGLFHLRLIGDMCTGKRSRFC